MLEHQHEHFVRDFLQFWHFVASKSMFSYEFSLEPENLQPQNRCFVGGFRQFSAHLAKCHACHGICKLDWWIHKTRKHANFSKKQFESFDWFPKNKKTWFSLSGHDSSMRSYQRSTLLWSTSQVSTSLRHHFALPPLPFVTTSLRHHPSPSPITSLHHHLSSDALLCDVLLCDVVVWCIVMWYIVCDVLSPLRHPSSDVLLCDVLLCDVKSLE